jgi:DNA-3-methyladenine glycosylase II
LCVDEIIKPTPPFDFDLSAKIFSEGDKQIRKYENGKYWQVMAVNGKLILIIIKSVGTVDEPKLSVELRSNREISSENRKKVEEIIRSLFDLKLDLKPFYEVVKNDKIMLKLVHKLTGLKSGMAPTVFEALIYSIIEQQISLNVAFSIERNLIKTFGDILGVDDEVYYAFPTPQKLASATIEQLRKCGLSSKKAEYIRDASDLIVEGNLKLEEFKSFEDPREIINELCKIRGVGVWTAELTMVRGMHKLEAIPADDIGLRRYISHYYCSDRKISSEEARIIAEKWREWKGLASFYLIMAGRLGVKI